MGLLLPSSKRSEMIFLAPSLGILLVSALGAFWLRLGLSVLWIPLLWLLLAIPGVWKLWADRTLRAKSGVSYGWTLVILSSLISLIYFLPSARRDAVTHQDGSVTWIYSDTQMFQAVGTSIGGAVLPPRNPGTVTAPLYYHFGPLVPATTISKLTGLPLGDALVRVTRGASLWALVLSCFGLGTLLSLRATGEKFGGVASIAGLFFYGALLSLFTDEKGSSGHVQGAILFTIPGINVVCDGGPFSHLVLGHSVLHGMIALTAIIALCLVSRRQPLAGNDLLLLMLPALVVPVNSFAALYCFGAVAILLFWNRFAAWRSWISMAGMAVLFLSAWAVPVRRMRVVSQSKSILVRSGGRLRSGSSLVLDLGSMPFPGCPELFEIRSPGWSWLRFCSCFRFPCFSNSKTATSDTVCISCSQCSASWPSQGSRPIAGEL
jgi:hypothetical protein